MTETSKKPRPSKSGLIILIVLVALFALPEIIAVGLQAAKWRPKSTTNKGELVQPARAIKDIDLLTVEDKPLKFSSLHQKWTMIYFADAACNEACVKNIYLMRQVHKALGKERGRFQGVFVAIGSAPAGQLQAKMKDYPGLTIISGSRQNVDALALQFVLPGSKTIDFERLYLVDPMGNLMMSYRDNPRGMLKDLIHLMKISSTG